jgi:CHAT domain-containing protein
MNVRGATTVISLGAALVVPVLVAAYGFAKTAVEIDSSAYKPLIFFEAASTGNNTGSSIDTNNPETIKLIEEGIARAQQRLSLYKHQAQKGLHKLRMPEGERSIDQLVQEANERLCDYNLRLANLITRDIDIAKYCSSYFKVFDKEFAAQYINDPLVEDPYSTMLYYPEKKIGLIRSLYKTNKNEAISENRKLLRSLQNGLKSQLKSIQQSGSYQRGIHTLTIGEFVAVINALNLMLASHTNSVNDYQAALSEFNYMSTKYARFLERPFRYDLSSPLAMNATLLAGTGRLQEAENEFEQSLRIRPFDTLSQLNAFEDLLIKLGKYEKALEISDFGRNLNLYRSRGSNGLLDNLKHEIKSEEARISVNDFKKIAFDTNSTIVEYSLHEDGLLYIWAIKPDGRIYSRQVVLSGKPVQLSHQNIPFSNPSLIKYIPLFSYSIVALPLAIVLLCFLAYLKLLRFTLIACSIWISLGLTGCQGSRQKSSSISATISHAKPDKRHPQDSIQVSSYDRITISGIPSLQDLVQVNYGLINQEIGRTDIPMIIKSLSDQYCKKSVECLKKLHDILIQPIAEVLPISPDEHIVFIPDDQLAKVPFAALVDTHGKYLIEKHTIYYAPSIKALGALNKLATRKALNKKGKALIVGNPVMPKVQLPDLIPANANKTYMRIMTRIGTKRLGELKGTENEAREIAKLYNSKPLIGSSANGKAVLDGIKNADIIHIATHGFYTSMGDSLLALTPLRPSCLGDAPYVCMGYNLEDGYFAPHMLGDPDAELKAQLVILSACESGLAGVGHYSNFIYEFIRRNVPSIIVSLWQIPDSPSDKIMIDFHKYLQSNPDKARALRLAMLDNLTSNNNPGLWSSFVLYGNAGR